jgi:hypothetical protein
MMVAILVCGSAVLSSCSGGDKFSSDVRIGFEPGYQETINNIMQSVKTDLEAADFKDLTSLAEALKNGTATVNCTGIDSTGVQQFFDYLQSLLDSFFPSDNPKTFDKSWNISNLSNTLQLVGNMSLAFEKNANNQYVGDRNYSQSLDVVVNDTLTYNIAFSTEKNTGLSLTEADNEAHHKLIVCRNGTQVLAIDTHYDLDVDRNGYQIDFTQLRTGSLEYKDMRFAMERTQHNIGSAAGNFVYHKAGSEVLGIKMKSENNLSLEKLLQHDVVFNGELELCINDGMLKLESNVDNMNKFYLASIGLAGIGIAGSSQENCQKQADAFNAVVNSKLSLFGAEQGVVMIEPVSTESESNRYRPELVLQPTDDGEKIILKDFFEEIGLSFKDIIEMITGQ